MAITSKDKPNIERLKELKTLYEAGILTKEEMEAEKAEIFGTNKNDTQQPSTVEVKHKSKNEDKGITVLHDKTTQCHKQVFPFENIYCGHWSIGCYNNHSFIRLYKKLW